MAGSAATLATAYSIDQNKTEPTNTDLQALNKEDINSFDRRWAGTWNPEARRISDAALLGAYAVPLGLFSTHKDYKTIALLYLETQLVTLSGTNLAKAMVDRYRPYAYGSDAPDSRLYEKDTKRSFFSGHAAHITSNLIFSAKVWSDYHPDQDNTWVWTAAITASALASWQRVRAGWHYPSDVIAGMLWGGLVGWGVPEWKMSNNNIRYHFSIHSGTISSNIFYYF
ncbi:MAG: phosphatase PAP2 family protein [Gammaproteobacteria bacterium]|nr:phosphatase PAP2 family protein [Gammaproteobacteria bacterium]MDH5692439.1 phosphatase PAP2 family protein [Gammaproteobacteria bacterium]